MVYSEKEGEPIVQNNVRFCSFCGIENKTIMVVSAGENSNICADCARKCKKLLEQDISKLPELLLCDFCQRTPEAPNRIIRKVGDTAICVRCVGKAKRTLIEAVT